MKRKKVKTNKVPSLLKRVGTKGLLAAGIILTIIALGIFVSGKQLNGYKSKAAGDTLDCNGICEKYFPNSAVSTAGKAPCTQSCAKVKAEIEKGTPCKEACRLTLMGRAGVCQLVCDKAGIK
ncbi:MAG: hypothetical protein WAV30_03225 [Microgenomates group bacterium]